MIPKWTWHDRGRKYPCAYLEAQVFVHFALWWAIFNIWKKCTEWLKWPCFVRGQENHTHMHILYTCTYSPHMLTHFAPQWVIFKLLANFMKRAWNDHKMIFIPPRPRSNHTGMHTTPTAQLFIHLNVWWAVFHFDQFLKTCTNNPQIALPCSR